jgi:hypothetical protein
MTITTKLTQQEFVNASFVVIYNKVYVKVITIVFAAALIASLLYAALSPKASVTEVAGPLVMLIAFPFFTYLSAKKSFTANKRSGERTEYTFGNANLLIKGESFESEFSWNNIYKIAQTKNWILIWQNPQIAMPIPKKDINEVAMLDLKQVLDTNKVKNNL